MIRSGVVDQNTFNRIGNPFHTVYCFFKTFKNLLPFHDHHHVVRFEKIGDGNPGNIIGLIFKFMN